MALHLETDPIDFALDFTTWDLVIDKGDVQITSGRDAVRQAVAIRLRTIRGEWFMDLDEGVPLLEGNGVPTSDALMSGPYSADAYRKAYREEALKVDDVVDVIGLDVEREDAEREVTVKLQLRCAFGDTTVTVGGA